MILHVKVLKQLAFFISKASDKMSVFLLPVVQSPINPNDVGLWN